MYYAHAELAQSFEREYACRCSSLAIDEAAGMDKHGARVPQLTKIHMRQPRGVQDDVHDPAQPAKQTCSNTLTLGRIRPR